MDKQLRIQKFKELLTDRIIRIFLLLLVLIAVFPFIYMILISLMETHSMRLTIDRIIHAKWTLDNYAALFMGNGKYLLYIVNSTIITIYACVVTCVASSMAAYVFAKKRFAGRDVIYNAYLMTMMIPFQAIMIPVFLIVKKLGMLNTFSGITLPMFYAYGVIMLRSFVLGIPDDLLEAAEIDGCNEAGKFIRVVLPLMKPAIISLAIYTFFNVWGQFLWPLIVASGDKMTITQAVASLKGGLSVTNYGYMMAGSTIAFLPPFILYLILQKQFVEGIALSGIKG